MLCSGSSKRFGLWAVEGKTVKESQTCEGAGMGMGSWLWLMSGRSPIDGGVVVAAQCQ